MKSANLLKRYLDVKAAKSIINQHSFLILGPRQTGKTTLIKNQLKDIKNKSEYYLQDPSVKLEVEANPGRLINEIRALKPRPYVFIDEAQKVPEVFDAAQVLLDNQEACFIFTGSSARKLRRNGVNLLPGRIKQYHLDPLAWGELGYLNESNIKELKIKNLNKKTAYSFEDNLIYGSLPGIVSLETKAREEFLRSYANIYLEEEIRAEALSRNIGAFSRFIELAAVESGSNPNYAKLSNETGISQPAIKEYFQILIDTLVAERVEPYLKNARKRILSSPRIYFFDTGVRNALARLPLDKKILSVEGGLLFEHAVILEIIRRLRALNKPHRVCYWRTSGGAEVDCVIDLGKEVIPIEIKSAKHVRESDLKGLTAFLKEYPQAAKQGYVITMGERKEKINEQITAIPWHSL